MCYDLWYSSTGNTRETFFLPCQSANWFVNYNYLLHDVLEALHQNSSTPSQVCKTDFQELKQGQTFGLHDSPHHDAGITPLSPVSGLNPSAGSKNVPSARQQLHYLLFFSPFISETILNLFLVRTVPYCWKSIHHFTQCFLLISSRQLPPQYLTQTKVVFRGSPAVCTDQVKGTELEFRPPTYGCFLLGCSH